MSTIIYAKQETPVAPRMAFNALNSIKINTVGLYKATGFSHILFQQHDDKSGKTSDLSDPIFFLTQ